MRWRGGGWWLNVTRMISAWYMTVSAQIPLTVNVELTIAASLPSIQYGFQAWASGMRNEGAPWNEAAPRENTVFAYGRMVGAPYGDYVE